MILLSKKEKTHPMTSVSPAGCSFHQQKSNRDKSSDEVPATAGDPAVNLPDRTLYNGNLFFGKVVKLVNQLVDLGFESGCVGRRGLFFDLKNIIH